MTTRIVIIVGVLALLVMLLNTRFGVFIVFDVLGDLTEATDNFAPGSISLDVTGHLTGQTITLPQEIEQASGIVASAWQPLISTDQAELFALSSDWQRIVSKTDLLGGPLLFKQGSVEAITAQGIHRQLSLAGELGAVQHWRAADRGWQPTGESRTPITEEAEFTGIAGVGGEHWLVADEDLSIYVLERHTWLRVAGDPGDLLTSGIAFDGSILWMVIENRPALIAIDPKALTIRGVYTIDAPEPSDVSTLNGRAYVTVDHNYFDPRPPLYVYELPEDIPVVLPDI